MTRRLVIANQKGGVGKTTTVSNLGSALAESGARVLLVDLDPQAALTASWGLNPYRLETSLDRALANGGDLDEVAVEVAPNLSVAPTTARLADLEWELSGPEGQERVRSGLSGLEGWDFVLADTPPSVGSLTRGALAASGELLIPVQCEFLSMRGVRGLLMTVFEVQSGVNPDLDLLGVLATRFRSGSPHCREVVEELRAVFQRRVFEVVVDDDEKVASAPVARQSVLSVDPEGPAATAYRRLAREVLDASP